MMWLRVSRIAVALALGACVCVTAIGAIDVSGLVDIVFHEDGIEMSEGPEIGDYTGIPMNDAARKRAMAWNPSINNVPERQCIKLPLEYAMRWSHFRMWKDVDSRTQALTAYRLRKEWGAPERTIYMDGRPRPPTYAPHLFHGYSIGEWDNQRLKVTTTHLKEGYLRINGIPRSNKATVIEHYLRHGNYLTLSIAIEDPVYLTEPLVFSASYLLNLSRNLEPYPCEVVTELAGMAKTTIPHYFPWKNPHIKVFATKYGIPLEAAFGEARHIYPTFIEAVR